MLRSGNTGATIYALLIACSVTGRAQAVEVDASAAFVSDYRSRGVSLSDRRPAAEASVQLSTADWFAGAEAVSTARPRDLRFLGGNDAEVDLSAGWSRGLGLITPSAGIITYLYPSHGPAEVEVFGSVAGALGPATVTVGANYAPDQTGVAGGNLYTYAKAAVGIPLTPVTVKASVGRERGAFDEGRTKVDYMAGVDVRVWKLTISASYIGNDVPRNVSPFIRHATANTVVGSVTLAF